MTLEQYIQFLKNDGPMPIMGIDLAFNINKIHDLSKKISKEKDENMHGRTKKTEIETTVTLNTGTALHLAIAYNRSDIAKGLIEQGADPALQCSISERTTENNLKRTRDGKWIPDGYSGKHVTRSRHNSFTAPDLAEHFNNDCQNLFSSVLFVIVPAPTLSSPSFPPITQGRSSHSGSAQQPPEFVIVPSTTASNNPYAFQLTSSTQGESSGSRVEDRRSPSLTRG